MLPQQLGSLGLKAKDRLLGIVGVISAVHFDLYGCSRATVSMANKDNEPGGWVIDYARLEITPGIPVMVPAVFAPQNQLPPQLAALGLVAKDKITGKSGTISSIEYNITGPVFASVTPEKVDEKGEDRTFCVDYHRLEISDVRKMDAPDYSKDYTETPNVAETPRGCLREEAERI